VPRTFLCIAALAAFTLPCRAEQTITPTETIIRLTVQPMPAPKPALRYLLLPELKEMNPGNPIQNYLKCFMETQHFFFDKEALQRRDRMNNLPLKDLPAKELLQEYGNAALRQADWAARLDRPDWLVLLRLKDEGFSLLLPEVQQLRMLANALKVRFRAEVALRRFDDALRTAKTMFALSRHLGEHPTLICDLVGIAIAFVGIGPLEDMLEQPGCPNLYWALTNLPNSLINLEKALEGELLGIQVELRGLDDSAPMSEDQLKKFIAHIDRLHEMIGAPAKDGLRAWLKPRARDEALVKSARQRLAEAGIPADRLSQFPADQVILLDARRESEERWHEVMKLVSLPAWQVEVLAGQFMPYKDQALFDLTVTSSVLRVRRAQGRLEQRFALLRHVEALRLYAAHHDGRLPATLAEVLVPLPADPFTGKPFHYKVDGTTAHLRGSPPPGQEKSAAYNVRYEVTIQSAPDQVTIPK
jgi:hypothetical protein